MLNETPTLAPDGLPYRLLTLRNRAGMVVTLMDWGATLLSARVPMPDGSVRETLLGCASPSDYLHQAPPIWAPPLGATLTASEGEGVFALSSKPALHRLLAAKPG